MIYIGTPFGKHEEVSTEMTRQYGEYCVDNNIMAFSPISYFTSLFVDRELPPYDFWQFQCEGFMEVCNELHCMFLYDDVDKSVSAILNSTGAKEEIFYFMDSGKEVNFVRKINNKFEIINHSDIQYLIDTLTEQYANRK